MTGHFIFSAAQNLEPQLSPSPFTKGANYSCYLVKVAEQSAGNGPVEYLFEGLPYGGGVKGNYELTFIAEAVDPAGGARTQWSSDPEFDTGN